MNVSRSVLKLFALVLTLCALLPFAVSCNGNDADETTTTTTTTTLEEENEPEESEPTLDGKKFLFLGSSVTYGSNSGGKSFVDFIKENNDCTCYKFAVSGTTLVDNGSSSYIQRLKNDTRKVKTVDHLICQLSTNDASQSKPLGYLSDSFEMEDFDTSTVIGAIEYIIAYSKDRWGCKVSFYTGTVYTKPTSGNYEDMIEALYDIQEKWDIGILDLWNDEEMNAVSSRNYAKYMADDGIHPTLRGYEEWWTPKFEEFLKKN